MFLYSLSTYNDNCSHTYIWCYTMEKIKITTDELSRFDKERIVKELVKEKLIPKQQKLVKKHIDIMIRDIMPAISSISIALLTVLFITYPENNFNIPASSSGFYNQIRDSPVFFPFIYFLNKGNK